MIKMGAIGVAQSRHGMSQQMPLLYAGSTNNFIETKQITQHPS